MKNGSWVKWLLAVVLVPLLFGIGWSFDGRIKDNGTEIQDIKDETQLSLKGIEIAQAKLSTEQTHIKNTLTEIKELIKNGRDN